MTLSQGLSAWLQSLSYLRRPTLQGCKLAALRWSKYWGGECDLSALSLRALREYLEQYRGTHAPSTTNQERRLLAWFLHSREVRDAVQGDPIDGTPVYPEECREPRVLAPGEVERLLGAADVDLRALLVVALETGLRRGTLREIRWEWISPDGWISIPGSVMKCHRALRIPLPPLALQILRERQGALTGRIFSMSRTALSRRFTRLCRSLGIDVTFHDLRRTFFTRARQRGVPLEVACQLSGHRDLRTALRHYRAIAPEELLRAVGRDIQRREEEA